MNSPSVTVCCLIISLISASGQQSRMSGSMQQQGMQNSQMSGPMQQEPQMSGSEVQRPGRGKQRPQMNGPMQEPKMNGPIQQQPDQIQQQSAASSSIQLPQQYQGTELSDQQMEEQKKICEATIKTYIRPSECCHYPVMTIENTSAMKCVDECENSNSDGDCAASCMFRELKMVDEGYKMVIASWMEFFLRGLDRDKVPRGNWPAVVEESAKTCGSYMNIVHEIRNMTKVPNVYYTAMMKCMLRLNFVNCVNPKRSDECTKVRKFLGDPNGCYTLYEIYMETRVMWDFKDT